jgi:hypothetical protein
MMPPVRAAVVPPGAHVGAIGAPAGIDPEGTVDRAHGAAHRPADHAADGAADPITFGRAALDAADEALGLGGECRGEGATGQGRRE